MIEEKEKSALVHWYYSVSEWEDFVKKCKRRNEIHLLIESILIWMIGTLMIYFIADMPWLAAIVISGNMAIIYGILKFYICKWMIRWKGDKVPEIVIADGTAIVNGKPTVFHGNGKWLRKVDVKENNSINILEITFEWQTRKGASFDEIKIPIPRGKLREAVELQDCLNLRREVLSLFS